MDESESGTDFNQSMRTFTSHEYGQSRIPVFDPTKKQEIEIKQVPVDNQAMEIQEMAFVKEKTSFDEEEEKDTTIETTIDAIPTTRWNVWEDFASIRDSMPENGLKRWLAWIFELVRRTVVVRYSFNENFENGDVRDIHRREVETGYAEIDLICPNLLGKDVLLDFGDLVPSFQSILDSLTLPMLLNTVVLSIKDPKAQKVKDLKKLRTIYHPVFLVRTMIASYNEELDVLTELFGYLQKDAKVEELYGLLVTRTEVIFVKYDPKAQIKLGLSHSFPANMKDYLEKEITKELEEVLSMMGCLLIKVIKKGREAFESKV